MPLPTDRGQQGVSERDATTSTPSSSGSPTVPAGPSDGYTPSDLHRGADTLTPSAPHGAQPPPLWSDEDHVLTLLGDRITDVVAHRQTVTVDGHATSEA
jgi:hypothetical protein